MLVKSTILLLMVSKPRQEQAARGLLIAREQSKRFLGLTAALRNASEKATEGGPERPQGGP